MQDFSEDLRALRRRLDEAAEYLDIETSRKRLAELEPELSRQDLWDDQTKAQAVTREYASLKEDVDLQAAMESRLVDAEDLYELAREEDDDTLAGDLQSMVASLAAEFDQLELRSLFTGEHDSLDAVCEVHAKDGGTDAQAGRDAGAYVPAMGRAPWFFHGDRRHEPRPGSRDTFSDFHN